jgi:hypothetical protein
MAVKLDPTKVTFNFQLTAMQAQTIFNLVECMREEPVFREIWNTKPDRAQADGARRAFNRQLNAEYRRTGVEV